MFQCPLCRQVANLDAQIADEDVEDELGEDTADEDWLKLVDPGQMRMTEEPLSITQGGSTETISTSAIVGTSMSLPVQGGLDAVPADVTPQSLSLQTDHLQMQTDSQMSSDESRVDGDGAGSNSSSNGGGGGVQVGASGTLSATASTADEIPAFSVESVARGYRELLGEVLGQLGDGISVSQIELLKERMHQQDALRDVVFNTHRDGSVARATLIAPVVAASASASATSDDMDLDTVPPQSFSTERHAQSPLSSSFSSAASYFTNRNQPQQNLN
jgi:hypothetical protein